MPIVSAPTAFGDLGDDRARRRCRCRRPRRAVMNTMSAPLSTSSISSRWSSAACRPISGSEPAPRPRVIWRPMSSFTSASLMSSDCASVLTAMNSTPLSPASIMRLTALHTAAADADDLDHREVVLRLAQHVDASFARPADLVRLIVRGGPPLSPGISGFHRHSSAQPSNLQSRLRVMSSCTFGADFTLATFGGQLITLHNAPPSRRHPATGLAGTLTSM